MDVYGKVGPKTQTLKKVVGERGNGGRERRWGEWVWENVWPVRGLYGVISAVRGRLLAEGERTRVGWRYRHR